MINLLLCDFYNVFADLHFLLWSKVSYDPVMPATLSITRHLLFVDLARTYDHSVNQFVSHYYLPYFLISYQLGAFV